MVALVFRNLLLRRLEQVAEECAIVDHRLTQIFRGRFSFRMLHGDFACRAVVHHDIGVINRDIGDTLLEVADWITARGHDFSNQSIGICHSTTGVVDETPLNGLPGGIKPLGVR